MSKRKQPVNTSAKAVEIMQAAAAQLMPPAHIPLEKDNLPFWHNIIAEKAKADWTAHDLEIAALLARSMCLLVDEETTLRGEGSVVKNAGGTPMQNPRLRVVADCHARAIKYRQTLGIHNRGKNGEKRDTDKRTAQAKAIETDLGSDLLASPTVQ